MKKKIGFLAVVVAIIGLNVSICFTDDSYSFSLSNIMKLNTANAESNNGSCYQNWQKCTLTDINGNKCETCGDPCNNDSGSPCTGPIACQLGLEGEC